MGILIIIVLVIVVFSQSDKIKKYEKEIKQLKKQISELENASLKSKMPENIVIPKVDSNKNVSTVTKAEDKEDYIVAELVEDTKSKQDTISSSATVSTAKTQAKVKVQNDEGIKNKFILMTGAVLIVLAAVVFLTSTWDTIPDLLKTAVIVMLTFVFIGASNIAKKVFKLEETAKTFLYIGLAYLPIALFSLSYFGLIGKYFSIDGDGKFVYYFLVTLILSLVYYYIGKPIKSFVLHNASILMQCLACIFILLCINNTGPMIILGLALYNILLGFFRGNIFKDYSKRLEVYNQVLIYGTSCLAVYGLIVENSIYIFATILLLLIGYCIDYKNNKGYEGIIPIVLSVMLALFSGVGLIQIGQDYSINQLLFTIGTIGVFLVGVVQSNHKWKETTAVITLISMVINCIYVIIYGAKVNFIIDYVAVMWIVFLMTATSYVLIPTLRDLSIHIVPCSLYIALYCTFANYIQNVTYLIMVTVAIFVILHTNIIKDTDRKFIFRIYSNIMLGASLLISGMYDIFNTVFFVENYWILAIVLIAYIFAFYQTKYKAYKIISYCLLNSVLLFAAAKYDLYDYIPYILSATTILIVLLEKAFKGLYDNANSIYLLVSYIITTLVLMIDMKIATFISMVVLAAVYYYYIREHKINNEIIGAIPYFMFIPPIYLNEWLLLGEEGKFNPMIILSIVLIFATTLLSIKREKINVFTLISIIYILLQDFILLSNEYLVWIFIACWSILHAMYIKKYTYLFRALLYVCVLQLYLKALGDITSSFGETALKFNSFFLLGWFVFGMVLSRTVIKHYFPKEYKLAEYVYFIILYLAAINNYSSELDGMIFVFMVVVAMIISYNRKYGPIFFTSAVNIIVNIFLLTREFWFGIPWWIYMLVVGSILITFAVRNELNEKNSGKKLKEKVKSFKEYMDM